MAAGEGDSFLLGGVATGRLPVDASTSMYMEIALKDSGTSTYLYQYMT